MLCIDVSMCYRRLCCLEGFSTCFSVVSIAVFFIGKRIGYALCDCFFFLLLRHVLLNIFLYNSLCLFSQKLVVFINGLR